MMIFTMVSVYILYGQTKGRKMKRILLTGASGFIGKNIKETLNSKYDIWSPSSQELDLKDTECVEAYLKQHSFDVMIQGIPYQHTMYSMEISECFLT